jgi:hypothetical protein
MDAEVARQLLERGFYLFEGPQPAAEPKAVPKPAQPPAASARIR